MSGHAARNGAEDRGRIVSLDKRRSPGHARLDTRMLEDPALSVFATRVFGIIRLHDFGRGDGCYLTRQEIARRGAMSEASVVRALRELRKRGYIRTQTSRDGQSANVHFCMVGGVSGTPEGYQTDIRGVSQTPVTGYPADTPLNKEEANIEAKDWKHARTRAGTHTRASNEARPQFAGGAYGVCTECGCRPCEDDCPALARGEGVRARGKRDGGV